MEMEIEAGQIHVEVYPSKSSSDVGLSSGRLSVGTQRVCSQSLRLRPPRGHVVLRNIGTRI